MYPIVNILGKPIGSDILFTVIGVLSALLVWFLLGKRYDFTFKNMAYALSFSLVGWFFGSHLFYAVLNYKAFIPLFENIDTLTFKSVLKCFDGNIDLGGFLGTLLFLRMYASLFSKEKRKTAFDIFGVSVPLYTLFCKMGCFLGVSCNGIQHKFGLMTNGVKRLPVSLIECYLYLLVFTILLHYFNTKRFYGRINYVYIFYSSLITFGIGYLTENKDDKIFGFSSLQIFSAFLFLIAFLFFLFHLKSTFKDVFGKNNIYNNKNILKTLYLSFITFGIYFLVVMTSVSKEINRFASKYDQKRTMNFCTLFFLVGPLTLGIGYIVWGYRITKRVANELQRRNIDYLFTKWDFWLWNVAGLTVIIGPFVYLQKLFTSINLINKD